MLYIAKALPTACGHAHRSSSQARQCCRGETPFFCAAEDNPHFNTRHLIFDTCDIANMERLLRQFHRLETLVLFDTNTYHLFSSLFALPTTMRRVHIMEHNSYLEEVPPNTRRVLPHLESFTFTLPPGRVPQTPEDDDPEQADLAEVQQVVESIIDAPQCTFKYVRSTESPEKALANALASLKL